MARELKGKNGKCPGCGGNVKFSPKDYGLKCEHCNNVIHFKVTPYSSKRSMNELGKVYPSEQWQSESRVIKCLNCGASMVVSNSEFSQKCPYCGSDTVGEIDELPGMAPDGIIPFVLDEQDVVNIFKNRLKNKLYAPKNIKKNLPKNQIKGIYIPSFAFDAKTFSTYDGELYETYTETDGERTVTRRRYFRIKGQKNLIHQDVMVETSSYINQYELTSILPFDHSKTFKFDKNFVVGYPIEHYNEEAKNLFKNVHSIMENIIKNEILKNYSYDGIERLTVNTAFSDEKFMYKICPIYLIDYEYKNKRYRLLVNGQTGAVSGKIPNSGLKIALTIIIPIAIIILVVLIVLLAGNTPRYY